MKSFLSTIAVLASVVLAQEIKTPKPTNVPSATESCVFRPTQTVIATEGCPTACATVAQCVADYAVTLECGCTRMQVSPTTTTVCPTETKCAQCTTAWGIAVITATTCGTSPTGVPTSAPTARAFMA